MTDAPPLEYQPPGCPAASLILLHGLGAGGDDLFPLSQYLAGGRLRVVCPHAPMRPVTLNGGQVMRAWYDIVGVNFEDRQDRKGIAESAAIIESLIEAEKARGFRDKAIFLGGFSQGAAMSLYVGLRCPEALAGIIALSGYLPLADDGAVAANGRRPPVFQAHGTMDPVVLPKWGEKTRDMLVHRGIEVSYHDYPMGHAIAEETLDDLNQWLEKKLPKEGDKP